MESVKYMEEITNLEQKLNTGLDLLEIAKIYCEFNYDKSDELSALNSVLEIIIQIQKSATSSLDKLLNQ
ncbi:MAG: hypothetical protein NC191_10525 [Muribaculaceae bacterium]|nr:hypothetical protein [Muribaculaceae bacterium]